MTSPLDRISRAAMQRRAGGATALMVGVTLIVAVGPATALASGKLSPPVIHESFTPLACPNHPESTLGLEGCAERRILRSDRQINAVARAIFMRLFDDAARRRFVKAQTIWLAYRQADCNSMSDVYEHGTLAGLVAARCTANDNAGRLRELQAFDKSLSRP